MVGMFVYGYCFASIFLVFTFDTGGSVSLLFGRLSDVMLCYVMLCHGLVAQLYFNEVLTETLTDTHETT